MSDLIPARDERGRLMELPPAMRAKMWQKGQTPNPGGKSGEYMRCMKLCRDASYASVEEIIRLRDHSDDDRVRFMAGTWLYERAWGKAKEYDPAKDEQGPVEFDPSRLSAKQLAAVKRAMLVLLQATMPAETE